MGYRYRGGDLYNDEYWFSIETGYTGRRLFAKVLLQAVQNTEEPVDPNATPTPGGTINDRLNGDQDYLKLILEFNYRFTERFAITLESYSTFAGKNTLAGTAFAAGIVVVKRD